MILMRLNNLSCGDKDIFFRYLNLAEHRLSVYAFENIYIWRRLFDIRWQIIDSNLCIFFRDKIGCFLYLPPLGLKLSLDAIEEAFRVMDKFNKNQEISRIENIEEEQKGRFSKFGYDCRIKSYDYLCLRDDLVKLPGNRFKSKRASINYFLKNYKGKYLKFSRGHTDDCVNLYKHWMYSRKKNSGDPIYKSMLDDSLRSLEVLLRDYRKLNIIGRVVQIDKQLKGFTFGVGLSKDTFCVLYEITDLSIKGLAQFIFHSFCQELNRYPYINIMDDSGLENLKKVKLSYRPHKLIPAYIAKR